MRLALLVLLLIAATGAHAATADIVNVPGKEALSRLVEGNKRYYGGALTHPRQGESRRREIAPKQSPFAVVLGCSDSRVPPEIVFDQGLGDLFDVRVAGNVADNTTIGSIEYSVEMQGVELILVLGHERCGLIKAALMNQKVQGDIADIVEEVQQVIAPSRNMPGNALDNAIRANVNYAVAKLGRVSPILSERLANGQLMIVGGIYDLDTGIVEFLPE